MARNKVTHLWTAFVTAFLALCTALGLITTTAAAAAVPQTETGRNTESAPRLTTPATATLTPWSRTRSLPPTMKQRIRAEAHGKSPSCRKHPSLDTTAADRAAAALCDTPEAPSAPELHAPPAPPLQR
ncbi:DUF6344 domain-containing protein [Streptomyces ziwulingensis]|uniref:DUF6344 domain-containing protein n=1 Tax=Streptomyces ziwulingensis TaxID=1045501 RepID=A0ABP9BIK0_9ACTN